MPTGSIIPFRPIGTVSLTVDSASANVALASGGDSVVVTNATSAIVYVRLGSDTSVAASIADMPVLPQRRIILSANRLISYAAAVAPSGSGTVLFSRGDGSMV
ncbi:MAG: hypothetical protein INR62_05625 [Rhodospirillales bacterium]|nr:hypothetical protein [Acetobacter sp.]